LHLEGLPLFSRGLVSIPDHPQLLRELRLLERRTARSGKDSFDHDVGGSDDFANSLFGALQLAARVATVTMAFCVPFVTSKNGVLSSPDQQGTVNGIPKHYLKGPPEPWKARCEGSADWAIRARGTRADRAEGA
jgi:hypothetical protein